MTTSSDIHMLISDELQQVNSLIVEKLHSEVALVGQLGHYIVAAGGKRLRPVLVLLVAKALGYQGRHHIDLAAIIEFIHTATLLHDDVVDHSSQRRGRDTANALFGNEAAVLVGDFLYSRSFEMMVDVGSMPVMKVLAGATNTIAEGEVMQLMNVNDPETSVTQYFEVIRAKTAKLFEAACEVASIVAQAPDETREALRRYGMHLGAAFQIIDDVLDYTADADTLGKNLGDDLAEGKPTLPLILTIERGTAAQQQLMRSVIERGDVDQLDAVVAAVNDSGALLASMAYAQESVDAAIACLAVLEESVEKQALVQVARSSLERVS